MSFLTAYPEMLSAAAVNLESIGAAMSAGNAAAEAANPAAAI
ncbi:hypothetical protein MSIMFB_02149 [Mycobacterium simulans]|uniref:PE domain-containing protein n=1 Tax=Mycobacterium simulans TaxID=627089 RepID=A0A7Z7IL36_9MYCO|nr:PE domain-containing protein [Mycobacterium simulans]SOJ54656.1 hypothetical protein MSIMFB_02149 [Mycobacterium simulans]SON62217.1 hypothetical protein MSIMFI_03738 [Mycobacterium simulans]